VRVRSGGVGPFVVEEVGPVPSAGGSLVLARVGRTPLGLDVVEEVVCEEQAEGVGQLGPEDVSHEEELVSRIWQHVYGLRADLICVARHEREDGYEAQAEEARQAALSHEERLKDLIAEYKDTYGEALIRMGEAEFAVDGLERLARWRL